MSENQLALISDRNTCQRNSFTSPKEKLHNQRLKKTVIV